MTLRRTNMEDTNLYEKLGRHLDQGVVGSPKSPALMEILNILFPSEEAQLAIRLPMQNKTLSELKEIFPERSDSLEEILKGMIKRGTVFTIKRPGQERKYRLMPSIVGWAESPFWPGKDTEVTRKLAPLWIRYREEAYGAELARAGMPVMRVLPISKTLANSTDVLPTDALRPLVEKQSFCAVAHCPCRQMKKAVGEGCDHTIDNCLHFGTMGRYMVEQGLAREITTEETLDILKQANEEGLVHSVDNIDGHVGTICNCCSCCCAFLETKKAMGLNAMEASNYIARVDSALCTGCGICEDRCPMGAIVVGDEDVAEVNYDACIGCGVCTPTCPTEAVDLVQRAEIKSPPNIPDFLTARFKGEQDV